MYVQLSAECSHFLSISFAIAYRRTRTDLAICHILHESQPRTKLFLPSPLLQPPEIYVDANRIDGFRAVHPLEPKTRMIWVGLKMLVCFSHLMADIVWQPSEHSAELLFRSLNHRWSGSNS